MRVIFFEILSYINIFCLFLSIVQQNVTGKRKMRQCSQKCGKHLTIVNIVPNLLIKAKWVQFYFFKTEKKMNLRVFFTRGKLKNNASIIFARKKLELRVFQRASKNQRGFWARAFQIFGHKKASKPVILDKGKSEEKKTYDGVYHSNNIKYMYYYCNIEKMYFTCY